ncbi:hypothetical protein DUZ99_17615 [Xylanibacillus composti]|uniref:Family 10 glycosylhydrolase n=1 Tax=Xylanibacillus composti TaxID=1572762 RepID=A0A8J4H220_9BACL|nr:family 10 glycosylhydrolase [Xylanibacillus composti]MDT9726799.1 hypothetical protein [Xylanibacillus composti]GIQ67218.1 family 10 glycosylhydrolase [Xylanibacillus composti]
MDVWWKKPLRIIQPNLQVRDTALIDPSRLAAQLEEMGANTVVFNVGGIYAWYPTEVPFHKQNEYLPADRDLLRDVIDACHKRGIRFIARFDFSKAEDAVYQQRPQWFVRDAAGEPQVLGAKRPGAWSLLMSTCTNGDYRRDGVAVPVIKEVLARYPIDGIFFNNPNFLPCFCDRCKRKYLNYYGEKLPENASEFQKDWATRCLKDNIDYLHQAIQREASQIPLILYYNLYKDNLDDRAATAEMLCTEPQDVLSLGHRHIPEFWKPALSIKLGRTLPDYPNPFGIVHSCPGMDWRHTGLPPAEYRFWLCQITANGGQIWHSLTGVPDTITDKRILEVVKEHNAMVQKVEPYMTGTEPDNQVALIWNAATSAEGWAEAFLEQQVPFDVLLPEQVEAGRLKHYQAAVIPEALAWNDAFTDAVKRYASEGGSLIVEGVPDREDVSDFLGIEPETYTSEPLIASYMRFEGAAHPLQRKLEQTELIPHRGKVTYCRPLPDTEVPITLVPPFSPLESVGAPPERASMAVRRTEIPLVMHARCARGRVVLLPFSFSQLIQEYKLGDHYQLVRNLIDYMAGGSLAVEVDHAPGVQVTVFRKTDGVLIHLVNGAGRRPLTANLVQRQLSVSIDKAWLNSTPVQATAVMTGESLSLKEEAQRWHITLPELGVWEAIWIRL